MSNTKKTVKKSNDVPKVKQMIQTKIKSKDSELLPGIRMDDGVPFVHIVAMKPEPVKVSATPAKISTHQSNHPISATV